MDLSYWYLIVGSVLVGMALAGSVLKRLPLTASMFYLAVGYGLGPAGMDALDVDALRDAALLERLTEIAVIVSLFSAGLKMRVPPRDRRWWLPVRLASVSMWVTVGLVALVGWGLLGLPLGAAVLLGAVLAPTDPVLASDVQVTDPGDRDRLRFALTGEAGLNDGTAFPFVMLGLGLLGWHELGAGGGRWVGVDLLWATAAGLAIGGLLGWGVGHLVLYLRRTHREAVGLDDFLALGLIALSYGAAVLALGYGFLAVFAAGYALRQVEMRFTGDEAPQEVGGPAGGEPATTLATDPETAPAFLAQAVLGFNEQIERIAEVAVVILVGALLASVQVTWAGVGLVLALLLVIRPAAVLLGLAGARASGMQRGLMCWFGVRGVGSVYYLAFAIQHGLRELPSLAREIADLTLLCVAVSIVVHGISVTPLMRWYERRREARRARERARSAAAA